MLFSTQKAFFVEHQQNCAQGYIQENVLFWFRMDGWGVKKYISSNHSTSLWTQAMSRKLHRHKHRNSHGNRNYSMFSYLGL